MALHPVQSAFRAARVVAFAAVAGASLLGAHGALAGSPACAKFGNTDAALRCEIAQSKLRTQAANSRTQQSDSQAQKLETESACLDTLIARIKDGTYRQDAVKAALGGKSIREVNACGVIGQLTKS